jgi:DNA-binding transcriptional LysR family regulator
LKTAPTLLHPNDLLRHQCLVLRDNNEDTTLWRLNRGDDTVRIRVKPAFSTNDGDVATRWALAGKGILARSEWAVAQSIKRNELVRILPEWSLPNADVIAIVPHIDGMPARVKQFLTFLRENFRPYPKWRDEN